VTYYRICNKSNMTGATRGAETANLSGALEFLVGLVLFKL